MARARTLKPGFFTDDELGTLPPLVRLLYAGLWCIADREGRLEDRPELIRVQTLPYDRCNVIHMLTQLEDLKFIRRYSVFGKKYIEIRTFKKHQHVHPKEPESTIPPAPMHGSSMLDASAMDEPCMNQPSAIYPPATSGISETDPSGSSIPSIPSIPSGPLVASAMPDAPPEPKTRKRAIKPDDIAGWETENPELDIPAFVDDFLNWKGSADQHDKVQGFRNQLRLDWKRRQFTKPEFRERSNRNGRHDADSTGRIAPVSALDAYR